MDDHQIKALNTSLIAITELQKQVNQQQEIIKNLINNSKSHTEKIAEIGIKSSAIEAGQILLFTALAETNPSTHLRIVDEIANFLNSVKDNEPQRNGFTDYLRELTGIKADSKPLLRLVPKRIPSSSVDTQP